MYDGKYCSAVIVAAGSGKRMGSDKPKQFLTLGNKTIIEHTVDVFLNISVIDEIILVSAVGMEEEYKRLFLDKKLTYAVGGNERYDSVYNGICQTSKDSDIVVIHDGVRPFVSENIIINSIKAAVELGACSVGVKSKDTVKICDENKFVVSTPVRDNVYNIQTPQTFKKGVIMNSYQTAYKNYKFGTDDAEIAENAGYIVKIIDGSYKNIKITTPEDLIIGEKILFDMLGGVKY